MPEILERAADRRIAPRGILLRHAHDESPDLRQYALTTVLTRRIRSLARNELPMPPENRVGRDDRGDLTQRSTSQPMSTHGEPQPFIIGELQAPPTELTSKDSILFDQVREGLLLLAI